MSLFWMLLTVSLVVLAPVVPLVFPVLAEDGSGHGGGSH